MCAAHTKQTQIHTNTRTTRKKQKVCGVCNIGGEWKDSLKWWWIRGNRHTEEGLESQQRKQQRDRDTYFGRGRKALEDVGNLSLGSKKMKNKTKQTQTSRNYMRSYLKENIHTYICKYIHTMKERKKNETDDFKMTTVIIIFKSYKKAGTRKNSGQHSPVAGACHEESCGFLKAESRDSLPSLLSHTPCTPAPLEEAPQRPHGFSYAAGSNMEY